MIRSVRAVGLFRSAAMVRLLIAVLCLWLIPSWDGTAKDPRGRKVRAFGRIVDASGNPVNGVKAILGYAFACEPDADSKNEKFDVNGSYDFTRNEVLNLGIRFEKEGYYTGEVAYIVASFDKEASCVNGIQQLEADIVMERLETDLPTLKKCRKAINEISTDSLYCLDVSMLKKEECRRGATHTTGPQGLETENSCPECVESSCVLFVERQTRICDGGSTRPVVAMRLCGGDLGDGLRFWGCRAT